MSQTTHLTRLCTHDVGKGAFATPLDTSTQHAAHSLNAASQEGVAFTKARPVDWSVKEAMRSEGFQLLHSKELSVRVQDFL